MNRLTHLLVTGAACVLPLCHAYTCPVYPTPQECGLGDETTFVHEVQVLPHEKAPAHLRNRLPADKKGAYALEITPGRMTVCCNDAEGAFYAKQTVSQLLEGVPGARDAHRDPFPDDDIAAVAAKGKLPCGMLADWPDLPYRGTVEGYYGTPWSLQARLSQFDFYGRNKMNTYIYAPKDDPYHHGKGCYMPYPEEKAAEIRKLVEHARRNHLHFVWAIHPANTVNWQKDNGKDDLDALCRKLEQMYGLGVRDFGVLVDDSGGEIGRPERQVELCNYILEHFIRKHKDVNQTLIMCPTGYNRGWTNANFLNTLGNGLDKSIPVMWTGDTVVNDITLSGQKWVNGKLQRPTFVWWNWPCSDFKRSRLSMGRVYGLDTSPEMKSQMSGFVANPMEQAEAGKVGLFGVADYTWNITGFHSDKTWKEGIKRLYPQVCGEMLVFCRHNSYLLPNVHLYFREESVDIAPAAQALVSSLNNNKPDLEAAKTVGKEFSAMIQAGKVLLRHEETAALRAEIGPWFKQFILTGQAGVATLSAAGAEDAGKRRKSFFHAVDCLNAMQETTRMDWNDGKPKAVEDVEVAMKEMTPALHAAFKYVNSRIYAELAGIPVPVPRFSANAPTDGADTAHTTDRNPATFWSNRRMQQAGDWICLDFGAPKDIRTVMLLMGGKRADDYAEEGVFESSDDGNTWTPLGTPEGGSNVSIDISQAPVRARMLRYRITKPRSQWLSVRLFDVNCRAASYVTSNMARMPEFSTFRQRGTLGINRIMEVSHIRNGEYIDLELPTPTRAAWLEIYLDNQDIANWAHLELTLHGGSKKQLPVKAKDGLIFLKSELPEGRIKSVRLTNKGQKTQPIKMTSFRLGLYEGESETDPNILADSDLSTSYNCGRRALAVDLAVPQGCREMVIVGSAPCTVAGATPGGRGEFSQVFLLDKGAHKVTVTAPKQKGKRVNEIIFR